MKETTRAAKRFFNAAVLLMIVAGTLLLKYDHAVADRLSPLATSDLVDEIAKAAIVAGLLAFSVDVYLKRRLASEFVKDVSPYIEGFFLPREFQEEVAAIRRIPIYRRNFQATYDFERRTDLPPGFIWLKAMYSFEAVNSTGESQVFKESGSVSHSYGHLGVPEPRLDAGVANRSPRIRRRKSGEWYSYEYEVRLQPDESGVTFWSVMEAAVKEEDLEVLYMNYPTANLELTIIPPAGYTVEVVFGHRYDGDAERVQILPPNAGVNCAGKWLFKGALLANHSVAIEWRPVLPQDKPATHGITSAVKRFCALVRDFGRSLGD